MCKAFGLTPDYVLHRISYTNLQMMAATMPSIDTKDTKKETQQQGTTLNGDDAASWDKIDELKRLMNNR